MPDEWRLEQGCIARNGPVGVSLQRYRLPELLPLTALPRSEGALPLLALGPSEFRARIALGEGVWLGLDLHDASRWVLCRLAAETVAGVLDAITGELWDEAGDSGVVVPPAYAVGGLASAAGGMWPITPRPAGVGPVVTALLLTYMPSVDVRPRGEDVTLPLHSAATAGGAGPGSEPLAGVRWARDQAARLRIVLESGAPDISPKADARRRVYGGWRLP